jgi:hypothetical protein
VGVQHVGTGDADKEALERSVCSLPGRIRSIYNNNVFDSIHASDRHVFVTVGSHLHVYGTFMIYVLVKTRDLHLSSSYCGESIGR